MLVPVALPGTTVAVAGPGFGFNAAAFTNENPAFAFRRGLDAVERGGFDLTMDANFGFHSCEVDLFGSVGCYRSS